MSKQSYFGQTEICLENGRKAKLYYYILHQKWEHCDSYGARIAMQREDDWETASVYHVTTSQVRIRTLLDKLMRNSVTPCTLREIVLEELNKY